MYHYSNNGILTTVDVDNISSKDGLGSPNKKARYDSSVMTPFIDMYLYKNRRGACNKNKQGGKNKFM